jgi:ribonuclease HII
MGRNSSLHEVKLMRVRKFRKLDTLRIFDYDNRIRKGCNGLLCGVDEAGRGPLAGPVVAAATVFTDDVYIEGVFDSKALTHAHREELYEEILIMALSYGIGIVDSKKIDEVNILEATKLAMSKAVSKLKQRPVLILADGNFFEHKSIKVHNLIGGDAASFSIAAASIIAKVTRDRLMRDYQRTYPQYSFSKHKGYGTKKHIEEIRLCGFSEIHRRSFKVKSLEYEPR